MPAIPTIACLLFSFRGRAGRMPFWLIWVTWLVLIQTFDYAWDAGIGTAILAGHSRVTAIAIQAVVALPALVSCLAVSARRLHDRDKSAWWLVPYGVIPYAIGPLAVLLLPFTYTTIIAAMVASMALTLWVLVDLGLMPGTRGPNRYGLDPRSPLAIEEVFD
jgi:uncharacterized membrane protein YhaH (DUF805 family)